MLWVLGLVGQAIGGVGVALIKVPAILADLAIGWLVWSMVLELGGRRKVALIAAFVAVVNPISWFDSVVWGQVDSVGVVFLLLGLRELWRDHPERSAIYAVVAALIKPQLGILIPILALVTIRRALWPVAEADDASRRCGRSATGPPDDGWLARVRAWERRTDHPIRILTTGLVALATTILLCYPFGLSVLEFKLDRAVLLVRPAVADLRHGLGLSVPDGQRVQPVGARRRRHRQHPRQFGAVGLRRAVDGHQWMRRPAWRRSRASRRSSSAAR